MIEVVLHNAVEWATEMKDARREIFPSGNVRTVREHRHEQYLKWKCRPTVHLQNQYFARKSTRPDAVIIFRRMIICSQIIYTPCQVNSIKSGPVHWIVALLPCLSLIFGKTFWKKKFQNYTIHRRHDGLSTVKFEIWNSVPLTMISVYSSFQARD